MGSVTHNLPLCDGRKFGECHKSVNVSRPEGSPPSCSSAKKTGSFDLCPPTHSDDVRHGHSVSKVGKAHHALDHASLCCCEAVNKEAGCAC